MRTLFWHPIFGRVRAWFGTATPTARPSVFLGLIDAAPSFLGKMDGALSLGICAPESALAPFCLGFMDGHFSLGIINAAAQRLGEMQGGALRLGKMPARKGS
jgi:hypothetical protein